MSKVNAFGVPILRLLSLPLLASNLIIRLPDSNRLDLKDVLHLINYGEERRSRTPSCFSQEPGFQDQSWDQPHCITLLYSLFFFLRFFFTTGSVVYVSGSAGSTLRASTRFWQRSATSSALSQTSLSAIKHSISSSVKKYW